MKQIQLTQGMFAIVDADMYDYLNQWNWWVSKARGVFCAQRNAAHPTKGWKKKITIKMHRVIMVCPDGLEIDHINHNPLDNRKCNLRICTPKENQHNKLPFKNSSSKYKGVSQDGGKWRAYIAPSNKAKHIGSFVSEIDAAKAYDKIAADVYGEFAYLNFETAKDGRRRQRMAATD